jgi:hypothetical protein
MTSSNLKHRVFVDLGGSSLGAVLGATSALAALTGGGKSGRFRSYFATNKALIPITAVQGAIVGGTVGDILYQTHRNMEKTSAKKKPLFTDTEKAVGALGVGLGTYLLMRHGIGKTQEQLASKGKLTWATYGDGMYQFIRPKGLVGKLRKHFYYGDAKIVDAMKPLKEKIEGALYADAAPADIHKTIRGDINYNTDAKVIDKVLQDKLRFGKLRGSEKLSIPSHTVAEVAGSFKGKTDQQVLQKLVSTKEQYYYKPRSDYGSAGERHFHTEQFRRMLADKKYYAQHKEDFAVFRSAPEAYIAQPLLNIQKIKEGPYEGLPTSERRVHFVVDKKNKVRVLRPLIYRWYNPTTVGGKDISKTTAAIGGAAVGAGIGAQEGKKNKAKSALKGAIIGAGIGTGTAALASRKYTVPKYFVRFDKAGIEKDLQSLWNKNKSLHAKSPLLLGADIVHDINGNRKIVEINDQSGFLHPSMVGNYLQGHYVHKIITGRDTKLVAAGKGIAAATATGAELTYLNHKRKKNNKKAEA